MRALQLHAETWIYARKDHGCWPLVKDENGLLTDKNNYGPIAIKSVALKLLEKIILRKVEHLLNTKCYQFGFKTKHSTGLCVFAIYERNY